ncbi:hypothetical protein N657DRAFT_36428 [Parathielavia appendiculata]|uniref:Uncharacterized protein n=1 Tax=Parathielavia appendiculata TaxID=2587402 RepID=A0AAN6U947_9PEZI|nr:hypothetical protein N657DRAFT_36428 [Parathielavia appendiculata]
MVPSRFVRWSWSDPNLIIPCREQFTEGRTERIFVSISEAIDSPSLEIEAALLKGQGLPGGPRWCFAPGKHPSEDTIYRWIREQIKADGRADFEAEMDKLLLELVRRQEEGMPLPSQHADSPYKATQMPESLLPNLLKMRCMFRIWSCKQLFAHQEGSPALPFDLRLASVQDYLRYLAARRISELERNILPELEKYFSSKEKSSSRSKQEKDTTSAVRPGLDVMRWFLSWQMILIYRQSLGWVLDQQQQTDAAPIPIAVLPMNGERHTRHTFRETTRQLFEAIIVIYSVLFHKKTTVERTRDAAPQVFGDDHLHRAYQRAWGKLPEFYEQVLRQVSPTDELFIEYIVAKESKILAKSRKKK